MMYIVFIIDHIQHLIYESKMLIFSYNNDRRMYVLMHFCHVINYNRFLMKHMHYCLLVTHIN